MVTAAFAASGFLVPLVPAATASATPEAPERPIVAPSRAEGATVARIVTPLRARRRLDRPRGTRPISVETSWSGQPTTLLVLAAKTYKEREWVDLLLPERPNGSAVWVPAEHVILSHTPYWVEVSTGHRTVRVYRNGRLARRFRAVVGKASTPTPHGLAAIYERDRQPDPHAFVGTWVLALTIESDVLKHFEGGTGRIGIHGRAGASLLDPLGSARSHGCIRIGNGPVDWMAAHVPVGTPVEITGWRPAPRR
jgi:lipoprotein-anchoring transpeptidase ErfK/SrfK